MRWSRCLRDNGLIAESMQALHAAHPINPLDENLTATLYGLCMKSGEMQQARAALQIFENALQKEGLAREEIEVYIQNIKDAAAQMPAENFRSGFF
jgi:hypothetical protein